MTRPIPYHYTADSCSHCSSREHVIELRIGGDDDSNGCWRVRFCPACRRRLGLVIRDTTFAAGHVMEPPEWKGSVSLNVRGGSPADSYVGSLGNEGSCRVIETSACPTWEAAVRGALTSAAVHGLKVVNREVYDRALDAITTARIFAMPPTSRKKRKPDAERCDLCNAMCADPKEVSRHHHQACPLYPLTLHPDPKKPTTTRKPAAATRNKGIARTKKPKARKKA